MANRPGVQCPRCGWYIKHIKVPNKEQHQQEWSRAFETWTRDEYLTLARLWQDTEMSIIEIAVEMERPPSSIEKKINDFKLKRKTKQYNELEEVARKAEAEAREQEALDAAFEQQKE